MRTNPDFNLIQTLRDYLLDARESKKCAAIPVCWLLMVALTFPAISVGQEETRRDDSQPSAQADEPSEITAVVFILDCSYSMSDAMRPPAAGANARPQAVPRLTVAKGALEEVLTQVAARNQGAVGAQTRVGARFYGHRVGWVRGVTPPRMAIQPTYEGKTPGGLRPSRDVELVQRLGPFEPVELQAFKAELERVEPWGETPLFLSLEQALADFDGIGPNIDKSIIVITDGGNIQFEPTTTLNDVLEAWRTDGDVRIQILGLDMRGPALAAARDEHTRLATATGGTFIHVASASDLITKLRELLALDVD